MRELLSTFLKGVFMGIAEAIPGVSGGTIALITGIYERLVGAIASFDPRVVADLPRFYDPEARGRVVEMFREMDLAFLVVLVGGMMTAIVGVTGGINAVRESNPAMLYAFFFGLIAASAIVLRSEFRVDTTGEKTAAVVGFAVAFLLAGVSAETAVPHPPILLFAAGALAVSAMVLPGVSGAFLLLLVGQYEFMSETLHEFIDTAVAFARGGPLDPVVGPFVNVVAFVAGAVVGVLTFARVVEWALNTHRDTTLTFLVALMVGALRLPAAKVVGAGGGWPVERLAAVLLACATGAAGVLLLDYFTGGIQYADDPAEPTPAPQND
jgi:putative membrane protein